MVSLKELLPFLVNGEGGGAKFTAYSVQRDFRETKQACIKKSDKHIISMTLDTIYDTGCNYYESKSKSSDKHASVWPSGKPFFLYRRFTYNWDMY